MTEVSLPVKSEPKVIRCRVCSRSEVEAIVNADIGDGLTDEQIRTHLFRLKVAPRTGPDAVTLPGLARHRERGPGCEVGRSFRASGSSPATDLATIVRDIAIREVQAGKLKPTLQHGLMAQAMLDKRAERAADRQLAITVAGMLAGTPAPARVIIEGVARETSLLGDGLDPDDADLID